MKKFLLASAAVLIASAPAMAADLGAAPYTKAPAAAVAINTWTGFYIGAMGGYAQENSSGIGQLKGGFAGGTAGYNWQTGNFVLGIEADAAWSDIGATVGFPPIIAASYKIRDTGTVRGRIGYAVNQVLFYGTGGYAWADSRLSATVLGLTIADTRFNSGWTAGAGVEVMFAPKWSVKAEYLYKSFDSQTYFTGIVPGGVPVGKINLHTGQVGVNYHF